MTTSKPKKAPKKVIFRAKPRLKDKDPLIWIVGVKVLRETPAAVLVRYDGDEVWFPKSRIDEILENTSDGIVGMSITKWIAEQKGIEL